MIAVLVRVIVHSSVVRAMASARGTGFPGSCLTVYRPAELALLAVTGLVIAVAGTPLPASGAARTRTACALRAE